jgi:hypothetical protein
MYLSSWEAKFLRSIILRFNPEDGGSLFLQSIFIHTSRWHNQGDHILNSHTPLYASLILNAYYRPARLRFCRVITRFPIISPINVFHTLLVSTSLPYSECILARPPCRISHRRAGCLVIHRGANFLAN